MLKSDKKWFEEGKIEEDIKGRVKVLTRLLIKKFRNLPDDISEKIQSTHDIILDKMIDYIF